jgi:DNA-binding transcriptional LysR family regulator
MASVLAAGAVAGERKMDKAALAAVLRRRGRGKEPRGRSAPLGVSTQAVAKMITALERDLGRLFDRASHGSSLTASGAAYRETCFAGVVATAARRRAGARDAGAGRRGRGRSARHRARSADAGFAALHARHPQIHIDVRDFNRVSKDLTSGVDVSSHLGWPQVSDLVLRQIASSRTIVVASPAYWAARGMPRHPSDLAQHTCCPSAARRHGHGPVDACARRRKGVGAGPRLAHHEQRTRDTVLELTRAGEGVAFILD